VAGPRIRILGAALLFALSLTRAASRPLARSQNAGAPEKSPARSEQEPTRKDEARWNARSSHTLGVLPAPVRDTVDDLLVRLDRAVPGRIEGFYVVGSACMGAFRAGRSDLDFVAIVTGEFGHAELARLRAVHLGRWTSALIRDFALRSRWPLVCNGSYLKCGNLSSSPLEVTPLAGHVAGRFRVAQRGFDVNPVTWHNTRAAGHCDSRPGA
jgi:hypothetical protein